MKQNKAKHNQMKSNQTKLIQFKAKELFELWISDRLTTDKCRFNPCILYIRKLKKEEMCLLPRGFATCLCLNRWIFNWFWFAVNIGEQVKCEEGWVASLCLWKIEKLYLLRECTAWINRGSMPSISLHHGSVHSTDEVLSSKGSAHFVLSSCWNGKADRGKLAQRILCC